MTDSNARPTRTVSMRKAGDSVASERPPAIIRYLIAALAVAALSSIVTAATIVSVKPWLRHTLADNYLKKNKKSMSATDLAHAVHTAQTGQAVAAALVTLVVAFIAYSAYRGRHLTRWFVIGFLVLSTYTGMPTGALSVLTLASKAPTQYKIPLFLAGAAMIVAVVLAMLRPSAEWFLAHKPAVVPGAPQRRGLFAPRPAPAGRTGGPTAGAPARGMGGASASRGRWSRGGATAAGATAAGATAAGAASAVSTAAAVGDVERSRSKKRVETAAVAKGADLARTRAKASKSRRRADV